MHLKRAFAVGQPYAFFIVEASRVPPSASTAELAQDVVQEAQELVRLNVQLGKQELRELAVRNGMAVGFLVFGALLLMLALLVALPVFLVLLWDNHLAGAAIWLGAYALVGASLALAGRLLLRLTPPQKTLASLEETKNWLLRQIKSNGK